MLKVRIVRTISPKQSFIDADTGRLADEQRQAAGPIRVLPPPTPAPEPPPMDDGVIDSERYPRLTALRTILSFKGIDKLKVNSVADILNVSEDAALPIIQRGNEDVVNAYIQYKRAERLAPYERQKAAWDEAERNRQASQRFWVFRNRVVEVDGWETASRQEIVLSVKHKVLSEDDRFTAMAREIELFEKLETTPRLNREVIPDDVRIFVWRRDKGRCVRCGSQERLEFDHIIPLEKGGSNTARNLQVLCERCNRQKGATI
jgi:5-methylcytosine-specific restriction endonuclease McrA